jgi:hypothetical protein
VEIENGLEVFSRALLIGVVPAIGQHQELPVEEVPVKGDTLFYLEDETPVRVEDEAGA